jgi:hypothetical protein
VGKTKLVALAAGLTVSAPLASTSPLAESPLIVPPIVYVAVLPPPDEPPHPANASTTTPAATLHINLILISANLRYNQLAGESPQRTRCKIRAPKKAA